MITLRKSEERRHLQSRGQDTWRTFDAECAADPLRAGFRTLETLDEEGLAPGKGFMLHPSRDVDVLAYVREGTLSQEDPSGRTSVVDMGECRRFSARPGTNHRSLNRSPAAFTRSFQCCITSDQLGLRLRSEQKRFPVAGRKGILRLMASPDGEEGSLRMRQDIRVYSSVLDPGHHLIHELGPGRGAWLHVVQGAVRLMDHDLRGGDGASFVGETAVSFTAREASEILLFDLA